jgi:23S rRNA (cytosine1962-C5)-methyltransferase
VPGLAVDRFDRVAVIHADSSRLYERHRSALRDALATFQAAYLKVHARRDSPPPAELPEWGTPVDRLEVVEHGVRYEIRPPAGRSVGLFLDMRDVRTWLREHVEGRSVLNLFAYTCAFGVVASQGGAARVVNLDLSKPYLEWGKANYRLNNLRADDHDFIYGDALDWLARFGRRNETFDVVLADPPSFSSTPFSVTRDYARLVRLAARVVAPAGILLAATNHAGTSDQRFDGWLRDGLAAAGRKDRRLRAWHEPAADFPVAPGQVPYLKVRALALD